MAAPPSPPVGKAEPAEPSVVVAPSPSVSSSTPSPEPSKPKVQVTPSSPVQPEVESPSSPTTKSRHPTRAQRVSLDGVQEQAGTLVNRAAEIVQSARGFLGSIWSSNPSNNAA